MELIPSPCHVLDHAVPRFDRCPIRCSLIPPLPLILIAAIALSAPGCDVVTRSTPSSKGQLDEQQYRAERDAREAIVIGGASGIGWASAQALAADGCRITIADVNADAARSRAAELGSRTSGSTSTSPTRTRCSACFDDVGPLDVVVNCAGFSNVGLITDMPVEISAPWSTCASTGR